MSKTIFINRFFYPDHSATSQMLGDLAFALAAQGQDVHVVTSQLMYDDASARLPASETVRGVTVCRVRTTGRGRQAKRQQIIDYLSFFCTALWAMLRLARRGDTVVVKTDPPLLSVPLMVLSALFGWRQINWLQDAFPEIAQAAGVSTHNRLVDRLFFGGLTRLRNASIAHTTQTVVLGEVMRERLVGSGAPASKLHVIANWSDASAVQPVPPAENPLRGAWGLQNKFVLGYSGNMGLAHEFNTLLQAANTLSADARFVVLLIGNGKRRAEAEQEVAARKISNVLFKPYQPREQLANSLSVADVHLVSLRPEMEGLIVPSKFYGIGAAGRPI